MALGGRYMQGHPGKAGPRESKEATLDGLLLSLKLPWDTKLFPRGLWVRGGDIERRGRQASCCPPCTRAVWRDVFPEKRGVPLTESDLGVGSGHSWLADTAGPCFTAAASSSYPQGNCPATRGWRREFRWVSQVP